MRDAPILVTSATGKVGREAVARLLALGAPVRALTRDAAKGAALGQGVEVVVGELGAAETLKPAFAGVKGVFVISSNQGGPDASFEANVFQAAERAGVEHIVKLSGRGVDSFNAGSAIARPHAQSEQALRALGVPWTILRPGFFATNFLNDFPVAKVGTLGLPAGDGKDCPIDPRDVAAVAVKALTEPGHSGRIYELTGPELLTYAELVGEIARALGEPLAYAPVLAQEFKARMLGFGAPEPIADALVQYFTAVKDGRMSLTSDFETVVGRPATPFRHFVRDNLPAFRAQLPSAG